MSSIITPGISHCSLLRGLKKQKVQTTNRKIIVLRRSTVIFVMGMLAIMFLCSCVTKQHTVLTVNIGPPVYYRDDNGALFVARYGSLFDDTFHFVRVKMPNGQQHTLPQIVSASGVRYTDEKELVWWIHQGAVRVDIRTAAGKWKAGYSGLKEVMGINNRVANNECKK